jgi:K+ transporter
MPFASVSWKRIWMAQNISQCRWVTGHGYIIGVLSLVIWTLILMITVQYVTFVMRADRRGKGGILALLCVAFCSVHFASKTGDHR